MPGQVLSDVAPLPAEDRESSGAVVLHDSRVRAQRAPSGRPTATPASASAIGHNVSRVLEQARSWGDVREAGAGAVDDQPALPVAMTLAALSRSGRG